MADYKKDARPQREKFEELAREMADAEGATPDLERLDSVIGVLGTLDHKSEAEARREEGKSPRRPA